MQSLTELFRQQEWDFSLPFSYGFLRTDKTPLEEYLGQVARFSF